MLSCEFFSVIFLLLLFLILFIYLAERESTAGRVAGRGRSRLPAEQGAPRGAWSQDPRIMTWAKGRCSTNRATQVSPKKKSLNFCRKPIRISPLWKNKNTISVVALLLCFHLHFELGGTVSKRMTPFCSPLIEDWLTPSGPILDMTPKELYMFSHNLMRIMTLVQISIV